ncbi:MAG TPA: VIT1/CCC1 transporter family protein [Steroidobacteraceae bacterium]|nr:VIT1/CCC1 transporter family protein [Steroidobacteraceae bacterium]
MISGPTEPAAAAPAGARDSWFHERQSAWLYRRLAAVEPDPPKRRLFEQLAAAAEEQAGTWARHLAELPPFAPSVRARLVANLTDWLGPRRMRGALIALKLRGLSVYNPPTAAGHAMPTTVDDIGRRHRGVGSGNLRAAVFGVNDGLLSNASLILGVAGAGVDARYVLTSGVAGLLAGALSMAAGEYVSVRSQREMYEYQIGLERDELAEYPDEEAEELALIYAARGMDVAQARTVAHTLIKDPAHALDALAREELGLNPNDLGAPWAAAGSSFVSFALGATLPLVPFLAGASLRGGTLAAAGIALGALFAIGMTLSLFTGRSAWRGGLRMAAIGVVAGGATFLIGRLLGVAVG